MNSEMPNLSETATSFQFLFEASRIIAVHRQPGDAVERIASLLVERYGAQWASVRMGLSGGRHLAAESGKRRPGTGLAWERSLEVKGNPCTLRVQFPGVTQASAAMEPSLLFGLRLVATMAASIELSERREAALNRLSELRAALQEEKLLARAQGIIASRQGLSAQEAKSLIDRESRRLGATPAALARRIVEREAGAESSETGTALRKIA